VNWVVVEIGVQMVAVRMLGATIVRPLALAKLQTAPMVARMVAC